MAVAAEVCVFTNDRVTRGERSVTAAMRISWGQGLSNSVQIVVAQLFESCADGAPPQAFRPFCGRATRSIGTATERHAGAREWIRARIFALYLRVFPGSDRCWPISPPRAIVAALDAHIVGQRDAKRAVAVALRNRWRRQQLSRELRDEVTPKNILMIGPTGCGKTEISRRLAKLAEAPFVKVEATKFTEVGYVGRDVEQIARDLVEESIRLEKDRRRVAVRDKAEAGGDEAACSTR